MKCLKKFVLLIDIFFGYNIRMHSLNLSLVVTKVCVSDHGLCYGQVLEGATSHIELFIICAQINYFFNCNRI